MKDENKAGEQLLQRLEAMHQRIAELEKWNSQYRRVAEALSKSERALSIEKQIADIFLTCLDEEVYGEVLNVVLKIQRSQYGYFGYIDEDGALVMPSMTLNVWQECQIVQKSIVFPRENWGERLWGRALRERKSFYANGPFSVPEGHVPIQSFLTVPILYRGESIGLLSVANKEGDYTDEDRKIQEGIAGHIAPILHARLQRDRQEKERKRAEEKYQQLFELSSDAIFLIDDETGRIYEANATTTALYGYTRDELLERKNTDMSAEPSETRAATIGRRTLIPVRWHRKKDGTVFPVEITARHFTWNSRPVHIAAIRDITPRLKVEEEQKRLEERLHRAEKMEALGVMAGGVAHDLNNILGVLVGYSELLLLKMPADSPYRGHIANILESGKKSAAIIQDLLALTRREVAASKVINLNRVVRDYLNTPEFEMLQSLYPGVTFRTDLNPDLLNMNGSPVHLGKMVMNLVSNAVEASCERGEVMIRTENRYLDAPVSGYDDMKEGEHVVLAVSDQGKGIAAEDIGRIFEPFYTKKMMGRRNGTGLGLAVVWGVVKDHGGYIDVRSTEGEGTVFTLYFPVVREEEATEQRKASLLQYQGRGESILVVDDVKEQRKLARNMLTTLGYRTAAVSSGEEAVEYLRTSRADLMVLDMIMTPGIDGLETYRRVLEISPGQKAVIVSGYSETERVQEVQKLGAGAYIRKPYLMEKIGIAIRKELDRD